VPQSARRAVAVVAGGSSAGKGAKKHHEGYRNAACMHSRGYWGKGNLPGGAESHILEFKAVWAEKWPPRLDAGGPDMAKSLGCLTRLAHRRARFITSIRSIEIPA
jgi:hypothetical protein